MRELLAREKTVYHLQEYAIVENKDGTYDYVAWDSKSDKLSWIRGEAKILGDVLGLTSIMSEGKEDSIETLLEIKYELSQLPNWDKTKYYCVITLERHGGLVKYCDTGEFVKEGEHEYKTVQAELAVHGIAILSE